MRRVKSRVEIWACNVPVQEHQASGATRAASYEFPPASEEDPRRETPGLDVSAVNTENGEGVVCADIRALLPVGGQIAIGQVVTGQTLVSHDTCAVENRQWEPWESAHVDLVGCQTRRRADRVVVSEFYVGQMQVPVVLSLVDDHSQHLCHSVT